MGSDLAGRLALVTGAGRGNGAAIAAGLAAAGARVIATDIDATAAAATAARIGGGAQGFGLDVADAAACAALAGKVGALGTLAILVNNAGILLRGRLTDADAAAAWERTMAVNLGGIFNVTTAFVPALKRSRGAVINIASINSFVAPVGAGAYAVSKAGVVQLTRALATELAEDGVRVNAIAPGMIETEMSAATRADPERLGQFMRHIPMRRTGQPEELVGPVLFLASDAASYVTGAVLPVDGGYLTL
jgi:NAD(P)-dependent dehydrogenase (short-subunit alcohol dehydrogenase family)